MDEKISETLRQYAEPLLELVATSASDEEIEGAVKLAITVWNAVVLDESDSRNSFLQQLRDQMTTADEHAALEFLIERKKRDFPLDQRLIGDCRVYREGEEFRLRATAHGLPSN